MAGPAFVMWTAFGDIHPPRARGRAANDKAKLPGPPIRTLKLGKPGWRPRSASAGGSACLRIVGEQRHHGGVCNVPDTFFPPIQPTSLLIPSRLLVGVWRADWVADDHVFAVCSPGGRVEALRQVEAGRIAIKEDVRVSHCHDTGFGDVAFAAGHSLRDQIGDQRLPGRLGIRKGAGAGRDRRFRDAVSTPFG